MPRRRRDLLIVIVATAAALLPFLGRPLHVDDPLFVWSARHIATSGQPWEFYGFDLNWESTRPQPMWQTMENPPLTAYALAAVGTVAGWSEPALHAAFVPVGVLAVVGTYVLAERFCRRPLLAAGLMLACPGLLVSATTLMADVPLLCLWVWAVAVWTRADGRPWRWWAAGGLVAVGVLTKYPAINLVPLLALHAILYPAPRWAGRLQQAAALLLPIIVLLAYDRWTVHLYGRGLVGAAASFATARPAGGAVVPWWVRTTDAVVFVGGAAVGPAAVAVTGVRRRWQMIAGVGVAALVGLIVAMARGPVTGQWPAATAPLAAVADVPPPTSAMPAGALPVEFGLLAAAGAAVVGLAVADVIRSGRDRRSSWFLLAWVGGVAVFAGGVNWAVNVRTLLPLLPAACVLAARAVDDQPSVPRLAWVAAVASLAVSIAVTVADDQLARANRRAAADVVAWHAAHAPGRRMWFQGHWGFQYYMQRAGVAMVDTDHVDLRPGDLLAVPVDNYGVGATPGVTFAAAAAFRPDAGRFVATMNWPMAATFYGSAGDDLPFAVGLVPPEPFLVLSVVGAAR